MPQFYKARLKHLPKDLLSLAPRSDIRAALVELVLEQGLAELVLDYGGCFLESARDTVDVPAVTGYAVSHTKAQTREGPQATLLVPRVFDGRSRFRQLNHRQVLLWHQRRETILTFSNGIHDVSVRYVGVSVSKEQRPYDALEVTVHFYFDSDFF